MMSTDQHHLVIAGASGVIGAGAVEHFGQRSGWTVSALSRRRPVVAAGCRFTHHAVDLTDRAATKAVLDGLEPVTHLIYAAVKEAPGLVTGWRDPALIAENGAMFENTLDPLAARGSLRHVSLLQGTKAYGAHRHEVTVPAREDRPRDDHPNFYWLHEDHARAGAASHGFGFTIFRPQVLLGAAPGVAMNPVAALGAYAALCGELDRPFACTTEVPTPWEMTDTGLLAEAFDWACTTPMAHDRIFNITNGDVLVLRHAWPALATALDLPEGGTPPPSLAAFFREPASEDAWQRLRARHGLQIASLSALLGESDAYVDLLSASRIAVKTVPVLLSTIKLRQAGFGGCRDSEASLLYWLQRMVDLRLLPPMGRLAAA